MSSTDTFSSIDVSDYRQQKADGCLARAAKATTEQERLQWLDLAHLWLAKFDQSKSDQSKIEE
jgi:hypothetical protein